MGMNRYPGLFMIYDFCLSEKAKVKSEKAKRKSEKVRSRIKFVRISLIMVHTDKYYQNYIIHAESESQKIKGLGKKH